MSAKKQISRRRSLELAAAASALPLVHIRSTGAAGKVTMLFWDYWAMREEATKKMQQQVMTWAAKNAVEARIDFVTLEGDKLPLTVAEEAQTGAGHDIVALCQWDTQSYTEKLEPVDDVVKTITAKFGPYIDACEYLGKSEDHWAAVPTSSGTHTYPPCARISMMKQFAGINVVEMYPAREPKAPIGENWTYDTFLQAAEACAKAGYPFGIGTGRTGDSINTWGAIFAAFGAELVNRKGEIVVDSDAVNQVLDYARRLFPFLPADSVNYNDASNNRALISGKSALIWNPPSAWAMAKRDAPDVAKDCWTFPNPAGPKGRISPYQIYFWGIWQFSKNKQAARELIAYLMDREQVEGREGVVEGYDIPPFANMTDFDTWSKLGPPLGTLFNYAPRPWHHATPYIAASSAPQEIAALVYNQALMPAMAASISTGASNKDVIAWAKEQLEGFAR
jgi:ABC-type glycerol-3-phosphate transport system substrate-binding protein